jgi:predicted ester cyclase
MRNGLGIEAKAFPDQAMHKLMPDLKVEVRDVLGDGDKVVVRNVWTGTNGEPD